MFLCENQTDTGAVFGRRPVRRVVHLKAQLRAFRQQPCVPIGIDERAVAWNICAPVPIAFINFILARAKRNDNVVHDIKLSRPDLDRLNPFVLRQIGFHLFGFEERFA